MAQILTPRQSEVLEAIQDSISARGIPPSAKELMHALDIGNDRGVRKHLEALERKGHIRLHRNQARGIELLSGLGIPIVGRVAAGSPIEAIENIEGYVDLPRGLMTLQPDYLLRVQGTSMVEKGIMDNDLIGVKRQSDARTRQIVVARIDDEVTVKELQIDNGDVILIPHSPNHSPIRIPGDQVVIEGVYTGVIRQQ